MKYQTQKVAMLYFYGALGLFLAQVAFGVLAGTIYVLPNTLSPSRHLGYAVQWFALAAAVFATATVLTFRKPRA